MRRVIFVWAVREAGEHTHYIIRPDARHRSRGRLAIADHLEWISKTLYEALTAAQSTSLIVEPNIYITGRTCPLPEIPRDATYAPSDGSSTPTSPSEVEKFDKELPVYSALKIVHGRPSIRRVLQESIDSSAGPVSVDGQCLLSLLRI